MSRSLTYRYENVGKSFDTDDNIATQLSTALFSKLKVFSAVTSLRSLSRPPPPLHSTISSPYLPNSRQCWLQPIARQHVWTARCICVRPHCACRIVAANALRFHALVGDHLLRGRAALVEDVIKRDANGYCVSHVGHEVGTGHAQRDGGVIDVVDEVMDAWRGKVHEAVDGGLGGGA